MTTKAIKVSEENYRWLCEIAGTLQATDGSRRTLDDALSDVKVRLKLKPSDLAGAWKMTEKEAEDTKKGLKEAWKKWSASA